MAVGFPGVFGPVAPGQSRWLRLRPSDPLDLLLCGLMLVGLVFYVVGWFIPSPGTGGGGLTAVLAVLFVIHGSTPVLFFLGALLYLVRWGRCVGHNRPWLFVGVALTVPLWFLGGLPLGVRGVGDVTMLMVPWNLLAFGLMMVGVHRTLHGAPQKGPAGDP